MSPVLVFTPGTKMLPLCLPLHTAYLFPFAAEDEPLTESCNSSFAIISQFPFIPLKPSSHHKFNYCPAYFNFLHVHFILLLFWVSLPSSEFYLCSSFFLSLLLSKASHTILGNSNLKRMPLGGIISLHD